MKIRIATRKSKLALWQAEHVKFQLEHLYPGICIELIKIVSKGDRILDAPLAKIGGKGLFVKELENALFENKADIAVHSMKDVPMKLPRGLELNIICQRENPLDAFVSNHFQQLDHLPKHATVGTSSLRRQCQLLQLRPDLNIKFLRGNVGTRINKLDNNEYDAIILAAAGLIRLNMPERIQSCLTTEQSLPAAGQGAIGIETRQKDSKILELISPLHDDETAYRVNAERMVNLHLNGGCQVPIACYSEYKQENLWLRALVGQPDGSKIIRSQRLCLRKDSEQAAIDLAEELLQKGAKKILDSIVKV